MKNDVIIITGGSKGLGKAIVEYFLKSTEKVICTLSRKKTDFIQKMEETYGERFYYKSVDITNTEDVRDFVNQVYTKYGKIDVLINNAGVARDGVLMTQSNADMDLMININLFSLIQMTKYVSRKMILRNEGRIINISSVIGISGYRGLSVYSATKAGIDGFTRSLARELGSRNILVNSIAPSYLKTEMSEVLTEAQLNQILRRTPLRRLGTPEDVIPVIDFLCSEGSSFITGQTFIVDGGISV
ncbi:MAG: SDR family oxidoreductase [Candidatus Heimdallarchaeota archaeon]|nr:SDR family oxidoreductase [Candidatus Heimdallarchaeota archaeon]MCK4612650.1 SDR family oxidoreductase [Candidatus Heimdallarchaeota archaeon]